MYCIVDFVDNQDPDCRLWWLHGFAYDVPCIQLLFSLFLLDRICLNFLISFRRVTFLKSSQPSTSPQDYLILLLCPSWVQMVEYMAVQIDSSLPAFSMVQWAFFIHNAFICCCLTLFHSLSSQKCNWWIKL